MIKRITYLIVLMISTSVIVAQNNAIFNGGNADGHDKGCYQQTIPTTVDFGGGDNDGYAKDCYMQSIPQTVAFSGGSNDGHAKDCYMQTIPQTVAFSGGSNDGHAKDCYMQTIPQTITFSGGNGGDGQLNGCANEPLGCFLAINLGNDTAFCDGQTLTLDAGAFPGGATYLWQDSSTAQTFVADTTGLYYVFVTDTGGCTGIDSITITVNPVPMVDLGNDTTFCNGNNLVLDAGNTGATYIWQNTAIPTYQNQILTVNTTGIYFVTASFGTCSDTDSIEVTVNPVVTTNLTDSIICNGDSALIFGTYQTTAGTYRDTIPASTGCDSILVQQLIVNPTYNQNLGTVTICDGDSALIFGSYQTVAGTYYDSTQTVNGCDSIVAQTLGVLSNTSVNLGNDTAICQGQSLTLDAGAGATSYLWMNDPVPANQNQTFVVDTTGTYYVEVTTGSCSATDTINVMVNPNQTTNLADSIVCNGDSALIFGTYETVAGTYYDTLSTYLGCDSILVQQLIVNPTYNYALTPISICAGDSALIFGNYETVAGTYYNSTQTVNGCDSIVAQTLSINPAPVVNLGNDTTFCSGNSLTLDAGAGATSYLWMNDPVPANQNQTFVVDTTGTYFVTATIGLCSATDSINVTVTQPVFTNLTDEHICDGDSALIFGNYETVAGTYYDTLVSTLTTCDSILVQELVVNPTYNYTLTPISICAGDSALIFGNYETVAGTYYDSTQTVNGCDSIVAQTLNINPTPVVNIGNDTTFCSGNSLTLDAGAGATSYLWMNDPVPANQNQTFVVDTTGTYFVTATIGLCSATDSINVTVTQPVFINLTDEHICDGDSALIFGNYETVAGTYYDTLFSTLTTCDSILVQELYVNPNVLTNNSIAICTGDSIFLGGAYQTVAGTYYDTLQTSAGCDSIVFTTLSVQAVQYTTLVNTSICQGDSVLIFGTYQTTAGTYYDTLATTALGCDSIIIQEVEVHALPIINLGEDTTLCHNEQLILDADTGHVSYLWNTNDTTQTITVVSDDLTVGVHEFYVTVSNQYNCSNTDTIEITIEICNGISSIENANVSIYPNPFKEFFYIKSDIEIKSVEVMDVLGAIVYQSDVHKYQTIVHSESISKGIYYVKVYFEGSDEFVIEKLLAK